MGEDAGQGSDRALRRKAREQAKIRARKAQRVTYDVPPALREQVRRLAQAEGVPASQLVTLALLRFLKAYAAAELDVKGYKTPSRSPRYDWNLVYPPDLLRLLEEAKAGKKTGSGPAGL